MTLRQYAPVLRARWHCDWCHVVASTETKKHPDSWQMIIYDNREPRLCCGECCKEVEL